MLERNNLPHKPGVYIFKNTQNKIIYIGKAIDLNKRVSSYFAKNNLNLKVASLVSEISNIETIIVESELEALILEANLIKKHLPIFNVRLTDDKDYLYIAITKEDFPKVVTARKQELPRYKDYFGPYPSSKTVKQTLKSLRKVFPWCSNPLNKSSRPCFYYHLKLCPGACISLISKEDYNKIINRFRKFLDGKKDELLNDLAKEMAEASTKLEFEKANFIKRTISGIEYITQSNKLSNYLENPNFLVDQNHQGLEQLKKFLQLNELPNRIEGYDISNIQGKDASGSLVVLTNGEIDKSQYRKFRIRISGRPNDYAMHLEMMKRRLNHPEWPLPQIFLIDGGRGQVRAAKEALDQKNLNIPVFGLAKRMEWLYPPAGDIIKLPKRSLALRLLQKIRDEAHRFALSYHRRLHKRSFGLT